MEASSFQERDSPHQNPGYFLLPQFTLCDLCNLRHITHSTSGTESWAGSLAGMGCRAGREPQDRGITGATWESGCGVNTCLELEFKGQS